MNPAFQKNLVWSALGHLGMLGLLAIVLGFSPPEKRMEPRWIDLVPEPVHPQSSAGKVPIPVPPPIPSIPLPVKPPEFPSQPVEPEIPSPSQVIPVIPVPIEPIHVPPRKLDPTPKPKPKEVVKPLPPKPPVLKPVQPVKGTEPKKAPDVKPKVAVSTQKVTRVIASHPPTMQPPSPEVEPFNPKLFAENLLKKLPDSGGLVTTKDANMTNGHAGGQPSDFAWYLNRIFQEMYAAWQSPFGMDEGLQTKVLIRVEKSGVISKVSLAGSSGNKPLDISALTAANQVKKLPPLPDGLGDDFAEITVNFKVQKQ